MLNPLFAQTVTNVLTYLSQSETELEHIKNTLVKESKQRTTDIPPSPLPPTDPPSASIQHLWKQCFEEPEGKNPLAAMLSYNQAAVNISRFTATYSWSPNLTDRFSVCDIHGGKKDVSSYIAK